MSTIQIISLVTCIILYIGIALSIGVQIHARLDKTPKVTIEDAEVSGFFGGLLWPIMFVYYWAHDNISLSRDDRKDQHLNSNTFVTLSLLAYLIGSLCNLYTVLYAHTH